MADFPVLTKYAVEITPTKKNRPRSFPALKNVFLSMMGPKTMNDRLLARPANSSVDCMQTIDMAVASAQVALFHVAKGLAYALP